MSGNFQIRCRRTCSRSGSLDRASDFVEVSRTQLQVAGTDPTTAFIFALLAFAAGFIVRPFGALVFGRLGDMMGKRKVLVAVLVLLGAGALLAAVASSIAALIVARAVQGAGGAVLPLAFGVVRDEFPADDGPSAVS